MNIPAEGQLERLSKVTVEGEPITVHGDTAFALVAGFELPLIGHQRQIDVYSPHVDSLGVDTAIRSHSAHIGCIIDARLSDQLQLQNGRAWITLDENRVPLGSDE